MRLKLASAGLALAAALGAASASATAAPVASVADLKTTSAPLLNVHWDGDRGPWWRRNRHYDDNGYGHRPWWFWRRDHRRDNDRFDRRDRWDRDDRGDRRRSRDW